MNKERIEEIIENAIFYRGFIEKERFNKKKKRINKEGLKNGK